MMTGIQILTLWLVILAHCLLAILWCRRYVDSRLKHNNQTIKQPNKVLSETKAFITVPVAASTQDKFYSKDSHRKVGYTRGKYRPRRTEVIQDEL